MPLNRQLKRVSRAAGRQPSRRMPAAGLFGASQMFGMSRLNLFAPSMTTPVRAYCTARGNRSTAKRSKASAASRTAPATSIRTPSDTRTP